MERIESDTRPGRGIFITIEGPDGAGKSTQQALLVERISRLGHEVVATREPGGTDLGERIRDLLLGSSGAQDPVVDALLFNAARRRLVEQLIRPSLERGVVVVCDRFADSTLAYQGYGGGAPLDFLETLGAVATGGLNPNRTVLLDVPIDAGLARRRDGPANQLTRFETSDDHGRSFHERVRDGFLELARVHPDRWRLVDASRAPDQVADDVWQAVRDLFG